MRHTIWKMLFAAGIATLGACSSGSRDVPINSEPDFDSESPPEPAESGPPGIGEGVYLGTIQSDVTGEASELIGIAEGWGGIRLMTAQGQYFGDLSGSMKGIATAGDRWADGSSVAEFNFERPGRELTGTYSGAGDDGSWSLEVVWPQQDSRPESGVYVVLDESENTVATFQVNSSVFSGSDTDGCIYTGSLTRDWDVSYVYGASLSVENCAGAAGIDLNGKYQGLGGYTDTDSNELRDLAVGVDNGSQAILLLMERL